MVGAKNWWKSLVEDLSGDHLRLCVVAGDAEASIDLNATS